MVLSICGHYSDHLLPCALPNLNGAESKTLRLSPTGKKNGATFCVSDLEFLHVGFLYRNSCELAPVEQRLFFFVSKSSPGGWLNFCWGEVLFMSSEVSRCFF